MNFLGVSFLSAGLALTLMPGAMAMGIEPQGLAPQLCSNGYGIAYRDTGVCQCFNCFTGPNCTRSPGRCDVAATGGNPLLMQDYWIDLAVNGVFPGLDVLEPYYRTGYQHTKNASEGRYAHGSLRGALDAEVRALHAKFGNAETQGRRVVFGTGATTLIAAAQVAHSALLEAKRGEGGGSERGDGRRGDGRRGAGSAALEVFAEVPFYGGYRDFANLRTLGARFVTEPTAVENTLQFATSPNNPTGEPRVCSLWTGSGPKPLACVYDRVYHWPSLVKNVTAVPGPGELEGITLFSLSKLSGHASTRVGWALVSDDNVANAMENYISTAQIEVSAASLSRALAILRALNSPVGDGFMTFVRHALEFRWYDILKMLSGVSKFSMLSVPDQFYLWLKCNDLGSFASCFDLFKAGGIVGEPGSSFGAGPEYIRIELMQHTLVWPDFAKNFEVIVKA